MRPPLGLVKFCDVIEGQASRVCGIWGFAPGGEPDNARRTATKIEASLRHRGPDGSGSYIDHNIAIGNLLLEIQDVGNGAQPMRLDVGTRAYVCVYNGEVYNYRELRKELTAKNFLFRTDCDTEVVIAAYAAWGPEALNRFDGQWALAIWECGSGQLFLARDPMGIKPLYYLSRPTLFAFASEPKGICEIPEVEIQPNYETVAEYLLHGFTFAAGMATDRRSFYDGIESLPAGHWMMWSSGCSPRIVQYAVPPFNRECNSLPDRAAKKLRSAIEESVSDCLTGDVPVGIALSGGIDSSVIAAVAAQRWSSHTRGPLVASCIRYSNQKDNQDEMYAREMVASLNSEVGVKLYYANIGLHDYLVDLDKMLYHFDEPHWEIKQIAMFRNYGRLKDLGAKIVLSGEGADELFFGYYHRFPGYKRPRLVSTDDFVRVWRSRFSVVREFLLPDLGGRLEGLVEQAVEKYYQPYRAKGLDADRCMQAWYIHTFLHWLLLDNDRCSMASSLEGRFPYLNRAVIELGLSLPVNAQVGPEYGQEKLLLREAFSGLLPPAIQARRKSPLPSPEALEYHRLLADTTRIAIGDAPDSLWDGVLRRDRVERFLLDFDGAIERIKANPANTNTLNSYLALDEPWAIRTPQLFGLLTLMRWWTNRFS